MIFRSRPLARLGAAALLASGAFTALGAPAHAAGTASDLAIEAVVGTKVAAGAEYKAAFAKITSKGTGTPTNVTIKADTSKVDFDRLAVLPGLEFCEVDEEKFDLWTCVLPDEEVPKPGGTVDVPLFMFKAAEDVELPYRAPVAVTVSSEDDTDPSNNSASFTVELSDESGVDLSVFVPDVRQRLDPAEYDPDHEGAPVLRPGETTLLLGSIGNEGDRVTDGVRVTVRLPEGVTFAGSFEGCEHTADKRTTTCEAEDLALQKGGDHVNLFMPITVAADAPAPVALKPGTVTAAALGELPAGAQAARGGVKLPSVLKLTAGAVKDVDPSDNSDDFAVIVAAKANGGGGGDGGLPVTGPQAGLIGGVGIAAAAAGGALFLMARRRRVLLVTPADEKPTA